MNSSKLIKVTTTIGKVFYLNLLWILFSIPLFTIGASTCAFFYSVLKILNDEEVNIWKVFIKGFKSSFVQGTVMCLITAACVTGLYFMWNKVIDAGGSLAIIGAVLCSLIAIVFNIYTYPLIARYNNSLKNIIRNSVWISFTYLLKTILMILIGGVLITVLTWNVKTLIPGIFFIPGIIIYSYALIVKPIFVQIELHDANEQAEAEDSE